MADKKKDAKPALGTWENPQATFDKRNDDRENLLNAIDAMDSFYHTEVQRVLKKHSGKQIADWTVIEEGHKNYKKEAAEAVRGLVDKVYDVGNEFHPLKGVFDDKFGKENFYLKPFMNHMYTKHRNDLKRAVGLKNYGDQMRTAQTRNRQAVENESLEHAVADIDTPEQRDHVTKYLTDRYKVKVEDHAHLSRQVHQMASLHMAGQLKDDILRNYGRKGAPPPNYNYR